MPDEFYIDGNMAVAQAAGAPVFSAPFDALNVNYVLRQDFIQSKDNFAPLAFNTVHPTFATYRLVHESEKQDMGGGLVKWTRTYAAKPATFSEPGGNYSYSFIGFVGGGTTTLPFLERERFTRNVPVIVRRQFYIVGVDVATFEDIPIIEAQRYYDINFPSEERDYIGDLTVPTRAQYEAMIAASVELVVEASTVTRWMGQIFVRETRSVLAQ